MKSFIILILMFFSLPALAMDLGHYTCDMATNDEPYSFSLIVEYDRVLIEKPENELYDIFELSDDMDDIHLKSLDEDEVGMGLQSFQYVLVEESEAVMALFFKIQYQHYGTHFSKINLVQVTQGLIGFTQDYYSDENTEPDRSMYTCHMTDM